MKPPSRSILIDWLFEVCIYFRLPGIVNFFSAQIIDRFSEITKSEIQLTCYQLIGIASLKIVCHSLGITHLAPSDLIYITADSYNLEELLDIEKLILQTIEPDLASCIFPSPLHFLEYYSPNVPIQCKILARFLLDMALFYPPILKFSSSIITASTLFVSRELASFPCVSSFLNNEKKKN